MADYTFNKEQKTVFTARMNSERKMIEYEFERRRNGWYIKFWTLEADTSIPRMNEMFLPTEVVEQILLVESTKEKLSK